MRHPRKQRGISTLLIAMLLLAVVTVIALFAASYGVYEQRTAGNEFRHKIAFHAADSGISRGLSFVKANTAPMLSTASGGWLFSGASRRWQACTEPKPATLAVDPCLTEPNASVRQNMYRYVGPNVAGNGVLPLTANLPSAVISVNTGDSTFQATQSVYATLCRLDTSTGTPRCSLAPTNEATFYVTLVSVGAIAEENASTTLKQSFGTYRLLGATPAAPLIAAGTSIGLGNAQIVPNPDAAGFGVPVSIWSKGNADIDSASFATCQLGDWLANYGNPAPSSQDVLNGVCASCSCNGLCPGYGFLSGNAQYCALPAGAKKTQIEGEDILDVDSNASDASPALRDSKYFPPDLFAYTFNVPNSDADTYLTSNATLVANCSGLSAASSGLFWNQSGDCKLSGVTGSLENPVVLVSNTPVTLGAGAQFFGIIFIRDIAGSPAFIANGTPQVYGSVIIDGGAKMSGSPTVIYNKSVLQNIRNSPNFLRYGPVPGSWSDNPFNQ